MSASHDVSNIVLNKETKPQVTSNTDVEQPEIPTIRCSNAKIDADKIGFMDLPGEIRNRIYDFAFPKMNHYEIVWLSKGKDLTHYRHRSPIVSRPKDRILGKIRPKDMEFLKHFSVCTFDAYKMAKRRGQVRFQAVQKRAAYAQAAKTSDANQQQAIGLAISSIEANGFDKDDGWGLQVKGSKALLGVNRQIHDEVASLFYSRNAFSFASHALMTKFLDSLTPIARVNICMISLAHDMQNIPLLKSNLTFSEKERKNLVANLQGLTTRCQCKYILSLLSTLIVFQSTNARCL